MTSRIDRAARGILFDMDGTLVDSTAIVEAAWGSFGADHGIDPATILAFSHGRQTMDTVTHFLPDLSEDDRLAVAHALVADEVRRTSDVGGPDGAGEIVEIEGAAAFVDALADLGVPVALVTSAPRDLAVSRMQAAGIRVPDVVVTAEDVPRGKPAPDCYLQGAALLGLDPADCIAFEDAPAGVASAIAAGTQVVVVGTLTSAETAGLERLPGYDGVSATIEPDGRVRIRG
ncbi:HAD-IA family hydrolase [Curtobacterium sp. RRHDQ10]|uniref:HAD-IA family hydrolase n=1 Tax=Curtobacterium phyllosphaerae TaxID=3413379 RepID=UPI003BF0E675